MVLEIISGKKNRGFDYHDHAEPCRTCIPLELVDVLVKDVHEADVLWCIQVGILCVQKWPEERPIMSVVLFMLDSENALLSQPKKLRFYFDRVSSGVDSSASWNQPYISHDLTVTKLQRR
ncbi:hypothetical protein TorRG33x02_234670 [Trema orientale]|uniref:Tyrosine-protein kinase n=1 Tax=Trema orientale TaxID=63057 RepID=A0A2P5E304_TREOI|nr:hypothetical protein TorRG33x02_234670 [Trema orientale]